jgi:hypothetical protein
MIVKPLLQKTHPEDRKHRTEAEVYFKSIETHVLLVHVLAEHRRDLHDANVEKEGSK